VFEVSIEASFSAAHRLRDYEGACERLHGHNYKVRVAVKGSKLGPSGMLLDFKVLKREVAAVMDELDHRCLNDDIDDFDEGKLNPTAENIAMWLGKKLAGRLDENVSLASVTVWESDTSAATYVPASGE
jgi:6-pyruvoyltetrahydropterin/6-carboxytetrahydropterin synthase